MVDSMEVGAALLKLLLFASGEARFQRAKVAFHIKSLLVYTRCIWKESLEEDMFCCSLETSATADGVFKAVSDFFQDHDISWEKLISVCTDGAPAMLGTCSGFVTKVKEKAPSLQEKNTTVIAHSDAIGAFIGKLQVWKRRIQKMNTSSFPNLDDILNEGSFSDSLKTEIEDHLKRLENEFQRYNPRIGEISYVFSLARNPFSLEVDDVPEDLQEQFRELKFNSVAKDDFTSLSMGKFWIKYLSVYQNISQQILQVVVPFSSTYLCEAGFSALVGIKTKKRNKLDVASDLR
ncbi:zinc finger BED domain-containing protein 5-like [Palaemon carinicauda]|uniref:zinc finger BED domain-containing protein 5-like n=1 Tax=Palaemon carinicauda TaxID=392227 RepID=UPI0035B5BB3B